MQFHTIDLDVRDVRNIKAAFVVLLQDRLWSRGGRLTYSNLGVTSVNIVITLVHAAEPWYIFVLGVVLNHIDSLLLERARRRSINASRHIWSCLFHPWVQSKLNVISKVAVDFRQQC